jgi:hypothetical protein
MSALQDAVHLLLVIVAVIIAAAVESSGTASPRPWLDHSLPPAARAQLLLHHMTLDEKVGQMLHPWVGQRTVQNTTATHGAAGLGAYYIGMLLPDPGEPPTSDSVLRARNTVQRFF